MSLYNMVMKVDANANYSLRALGLHYSLVPRLRDCWLEGDTIVVYTRTGGGNREEYKEANDALTKIAGYIRDEDDPEDGTYARFIYSVPAAYRSDLIRIAEITKALGFGPDTRGAAGMFLHVGMRKWDFVQPDNHEQLLDEGAEIAERLNKTLPPMDSLEKESSE